MKMKQVAGIYLPENETHLVPFLEDSVKGRNKRGFYQLHTLSAFLNHIPSARRRTILDIGGHVGLWSMHLSKYFDKVEAFEPTPILQECFRANVLNHPEYFCDNVALHLLALGSTNGHVSISFETDNSGHTHVAPDDQSKLIEGAQYYKAEMKRLDDFGFENVDAIKIDVEGFELDVLLGAEATIRYQKPFICIEQKPHGFYDWDQFEASRTLVRWGAKPVQRIVDDYIFAWE